MSPAKRELAKNLLLNHSVPDVKALLNRSISGEPVTYAQIETIRRTMVIEGKLQARAQKAEESVVQSLKPDAEPFVDRNASAIRMATAQASASLHDATLAMYARKANRHGWTLELAMKSCLAPGSMAA